MFFENSSHCLPNIPNVKNSSNVGSNKQHSRQNRQVPVLLQVYIAFSSPGLVVKGGDSRYESCEFDSRPCILTTFFTLICCKMCIVCLKRPKINKNCRGGRPFLKIAFWRFIWRSNYYFEEAEFVWNDKLPIYYFLCHRADLWLVKRTWQTVLHWTNRKIN